MPRDPEDLVRELRRMAALMRRTAQKQGTLAVALLKPDLDVLEDAANLIADTLTGVKTNG